MHRWRTAKARASAPPDERGVDFAAPFVLTDGTDAPRITALNAAARRAGAAVGETLADARARIGALAVRRAEPQADAEALASLAQWATRYTPSAALFRAESGSDGFFLDITGAAHLLGGEAALLADIAHRLRAFGLPARLAVAETAGTAWAISHFATGIRTCVPAGGESAALAPLPIEGLRLAPETALTLRRLGFKRIGALVGTPRAPLAARFERELLRALDRALGKAPEPLALLAPPPAYVRTRTLLEPITTEDAIVHGAMRLMQDLAPRLEADGVGARSLALALYRVDGAVQEIAIGLALPTRSPEHVAALLRLKLERVGRLVEAGYGFETLRLAVTVTQRMVPHQDALAALRTDEAERTRRSRMLAEALRQRLGAARVQCLAPVASHWPERSEVRCDAAFSDPSSESWPDTADAPLRPPLLLARAEPVEVIAALPEGPPQRLRWRGRLYALAHAQGPERIAPEWWRTSETLTRDYYLAEDDAGRRFWLYREGLPGRETAAPRWFLHGMFA